MSQRLLLHSAPGFVDDLSEENKKLWSDMISSKLMLTDRVSPDLEPQFYDATKVVEKEPIASRKIKWIAFPKQIKDAHSVPEDAWKLADSSRSVQDEYCEWSIKRDSNGKMLKIVFCNEGPEYYQFLAEKQKDVLLTLYRDLNPEFHDEIKMEDLFDEQGNYNPKNKWNNSTTTGSIMHLIQDANTLGAEVDLAALATVLRQDQDGTPIHDQVKLLECGYYGNPNRNSDPHIASEVNNLAWNGAMITIEDPVGIYIDSVQYDYITTPAKASDEDVSKWWKFPRGQKNKHMRAEFEVPKDKPYVLGDLFVNGQPLNYGGQLAELISISLTGRASDTKGKNNIVPRLPDAPPPLPETEASQLSLSSAKKHSRNL